MSHPLGRPRAHWSAKLERILNGVIAKEAYSGSWRDSLLGRTLTGTFEVEAVYVFGSYARGAQVCGDLDLLLEVRTTNGYQPPSALVKNLAIGRPTHVDVLVDSAGTDYFRSQFSEAQLVWSRAQPDWRSNLAALPASADVPRLRTRCLSR